MDELELLKKDWKKQDDKFPKVSHSEIYSMILKKSSSIVKWIFIISLIEFAVLAVIPFTVQDTEFMQRFEAYDTNILFILLTFLSYAIPAYFFYRFYVNYRTISATDDIKALMQNILRTRRTVKQYVGVNLLLLFVSTFVMLGMQFNNDELMLSAIDKASANGELFAFYAKTILITLFALTVAIGLVLGVYYLIYGLLLRRLNKNYRELKKLEV